MSNYERAAFFEVVDNAQPAESSYVSLYRDVPFYGGPEEGGWWGSDTELVAYRECSNDIEAQAIRDKVTKLADELSKRAKDDFGRQCQREMEWLEARGLDADYLPEPDGEIHYWVAVEERPGSLVSQGSRHYE